MDRRYKYIGTAIDYPIETIGGRLAIAEGQRVIENSILTILTTPIGSRYFLGDFGSRLDDYRFEPNDEVLMRLLRVGIMDAVGKWEKRALVVDVVFAAAIDVVLCDIQYMILPEREVRSFVYPYYRALAT